MQISFLSHCISIEHILWNIIIVSTHYRCFLPRCNLRKLTLTKHHEQRKLYCNRPMYCKTEEEESKLRMLNNYNIFWSHQIYKLLPIFQYFQIKKSWINALQKSQIEKSIVNFANSETCVPDNTWYSREWTFDHERNTLKKECPGGLDVTGNHFFQQRYELYILQAHGYWWNFVSMYLSCAS